MVELETMRSRARKETSTPEVRRYYKQFAEAKHLEYRSWVDNEVFALIDVRKVKPRNYVTVRWVLTIETDKQGNFLKAMAIWVLRGFQDKQKEYLHTDSPAFTRPGFRMSCHMAARKGWDLFHIDLKTAFLQRQSYDVNRDVVCQLPPEAGHPPYIVARLKKPYIQVTQGKAIEELEEIPVERNTNEDLHCIGAMHTRYRSLLGQINWLQSRTQFQCCYKFSRCASKAASPTIGDVKVSTSRRDSSNHSK